MISNKEKGFTIIEHSSDIGISVWAKNEVELFEVCAYAMFSIICNINKVEKIIVKKIRIFEKLDYDNNRISNSSKSLLLLDDALIYWLEKLLYLHEIYKLLFSYFHISKLDIDKTKLKIFGIACGEKIDQKKHEIFVSIKAPTYHMLEVKKDTITGLWSAKVIFDV